MKHLFLNKEDRLLAINVLKKAKQYIRDDSESYVCHAVERADPLGFFATIIRVEIERRLGDHYVVDNWLIHEAGVSETDMQEEIMRQYRSNWIQSMIKELK